MPESDKRGQGWRVVRRSFGQHVNGWIDAQPGDYVYLLWSRPDSFGGRWTYWVLVTNLRFCGALTVRGPVPADRADDRSRWIDRPFDAKSGRER